MDQTNPALSEELVALAEKKGRYPHVLPDQQSAIRGRILSMQGRVDFTAP